MGVIECCALQPLLRMRTAARIIRLGYNLLFLDTDIIIFDEPYRWGVRRKR